MSAELEKVEGPAEGGLERAKGYAWSEAGLEWKRRVVGNDVAVKTVTIATQTSGEVDLEGYKLAGVVMPGTWTAANLTFQAAAASGGTFRDVYDDLGNEVEVAAAGGRSIGVDNVAGALAAFRYLKLRSGTSGTPVSQAASREITLVLKG